MDIYDAIADDLFELHRGSSVERKFEGDINALTIEEAYTAQDRLTARRIAIGEEPVGYKIGCTSRAIREQTGLKESIFGRLMSPYIYWGEATLRSEDYANCAVEPEFVLKLSRDITAEEVDSEALADAIEFVAPGIELHRQQFLYGSPTTQELIASNGILAGLVIGDTRTDIRAFDSEAESVGIWVNGEEIATGIGADIQGGPLSSLAWLAKKLIERGTHLKAGDLVIPGSATPLIPISPGDTIEARFGHCGSAFARLV